MLIRKRFAHWAISKIETRKALQSLKWKINANELFLAAVLKHGQENYRERWFQPPASPSSPVPSLPSGHNASYSSRQIPRRRGRWASLAWDVKDSPHELAEEVNFITAPKADRGTIRACLLNSAEYHARPVCFPVTPGSAGCRSGFCHRPGWLCVVPAIIQYQKYFIPASYNNAEVVHSNSWDKVFLIFYSNDRGHDSWL